MLYAQYFRWLPNALSGGRAVLGLFVFVAAANGAWLLGFWLFIAALLTDFFDGLAAKKLNARTRLGARIDAYADSALVAGGVVGLAVAGVIPPWLAFLVLAGGVVIGEERWFFPPRTKRARGVRKLSMVACLFVAWIAISWIYAANAFGWSWRYVFVTLTILAVLASLKRHRIKAWSQGWD